MWQESIIKKGLTIQAKKREKKSALDENKSSFDQKRFLQLGVSHFIKT